MSAVDAVMAELTGQRADLGWLAAQLNERYRRLAELEVHVRRTSPLVSLWAHTERLGDLPTAPAPQNIVWETLQEAEALLEGLTSMDSGDSVVELLPDVSLLSLYGTADAEVTSGR